MLPSFPVNVTYQARTRDHILVLSFLLFVATGRTLRSYYLHAADGCSMPVHSWGLVLLDLLLSTNLAFFISIVEIIIVFLVFFVFSTPVFWGVYLSLLYMTLIQ
ncbi:hypothetical protein Ancab_007670 [Ancistrocladus abbreviatus]